MDVSVAYKVRPRNVHSVSLVAHVKCGDHDNKTGKVKSFLSYTDSHSGHDLHFCELQLMTRDHRHAASYWCTVYLSAFTGTHYGYPTRVGRAAVM